MIWIISLLIISTLFGGLAVMYFGYRERSIHLPRILGGSFLFTITIIHILPDVFSASDSSFKTGIFILAGFFFQQLLEHFTSGVEHGHFHLKDHGPGKYSVLVALIIHSVLEGAILTPNSTFHQANEVHSLLLGIILHKAPAAFALMAVFKSTQKISGFQVLILLIFSLASPLGLIASEYILSISEAHLEILFALVGGSFLHISTTIFVESSPEHHFGWNKFLVGLLGAALAIFSTYLI